MAVTRRQMLAGAAAALASIPALWQGANWPQRSVRIIKGEHRQLEKFHLD